MNEKLATDKRMPIAEILTSTLFATLIWALPALLA